MKYIRFLSLLILAAAPVLAQNAQVVLASTRAGRIEFFDPSLNRIASIGVNGGLESLASSPDGRRLYIGQDASSGSCCGLFALDLETRKMCQIVQPARFGVPSPDGRLLFTQTGRGVDVFDAATLGRARHIDAPGSYSLQPSSDGRWLMGVTNTPKPYLDIFSTNGTHPARRIPIPSGPATGAWSGNSFYIFSYGEPGEGQFWSIKPEDAGLTREHPVALPDFHGDCDQSVLLMLSGAPDGLFLAEGFGFALDRRRLCPDAVDGGLYKIDPASGHVSHFAPHIHIHRLAVNTDGSSVYAIETGESPPFSSPQLLQIDGRTGLILHHAQLESGDWNVALAPIPPALIPSHNVHATLSCAR